MIVLYHGSGAQDFTLTGESFPKEEYSKIKHNVERLLRARNWLDAVNYLENIPFSIKGAENHFNDEFFVLHASVPLSQYEDLRCKVADTACKRAFSRIATTMNEVDAYVRFIAVDLSLESPQIADGGVSSDRRLKKFEIHKLVQKYIGVEAGYLGDFSYRTHHEFYIDLDLDIDPDEYTGTTRERFITILDGSPPSVQATILEGILSRYPVGSADFRTQELHAEIRSWIVRLRGAALVEAPSLRVTSAVVEMALSDAGTLLKSGKAPSAVDRVHTALHGYLAAICKRAGLTIERNTGLTGLFKLVREEHPAFSNVGPRQDEIKRMLNATSTILDSMNTLRNRASVAHPNEQLLEEGEAMLVINSARTILHYLDTKLSLYGEDNPKEQ